MRFVVFSIFLMIPLLSNSQDQAADISLLNSPLEEQCPVLSPDGKLLAFTLADHPQNVAHTKDLGDIWFSVKTETGWSKPFHGGNLINNSHHNTVAGFSADGSQIFLMGHYAAPGAQVTSQGLSVSVRIGEGWSAPVNIAIPYFKNKTPYNSGSLSADGTVLVFSGEGYTTVGAEDIYVAIRINGKWSEPKSVGRDINTTKQDVSPWLSPDKKRLFFASNGYKDDVSFDIYYSDRLDDTWQKWTAPVALGDDVNSPGRELFYRQTSGGAFFTSTRNSDGMADIRFVPSKDTLEVPVMIDPTEEIKVVKVDTLLKIDELTYKKELADGQTRIWGKVYDAKTNQVIAGAAIHFTAAKNYPATAGSSGDFEVKVPGVEEYSVKVEAPGYIGEFERLDLRTQVLKDLEMNFRLLPVEVGTTINLKSVLFERSKPVLLQSSYDELDMVADFMKENPKVEILLSGHTDNQGRHDLNMRLSRERVAVVKDYLVAKGINANRITSKGLGGTKPIADNDAEETRALNRRVEFTIMKD
jgi:OOP family OmpA-OmpF porin